MAPRVIDGGGPVLTRAKIVLSFRGSGWEGTFSPSDARQAFNATLASPYLSRLLQYRGIRRAHIVYTETNTTDIGTLGPDPRKFVSSDIWLVSDEAIRNVVRAAARARPLRNDEELLYIVVISQDPIPIVPESQDASGYHSQFDENGISIKYAVVLNQSAATSDQTWGYLPGVFSHELVEACTDPDTTSGFRLDNGEELADLEDERAIRLPGVDHVMRLAAYWSELEGGAVAPTTYSLRVALGKKSTESLPSVRAEMKGPSLRKAILALCDP